MSCESTLPGGNRLTEEQESLLAMFLEKEGVEDAAEVERKPIIVVRPEDRYKPFPLTDIQLAYVIGRENAALGMSDVSSHVYFELETRHLDVERYQAAWRKLIERHDMMRCIILPNGRQRVLETVPPYDIRYFDLRGLSEEEKSAKLDAIRDELGQIIKPADIWPMFDIYVSRLDEKTYHIHLSLEGLFGDVLSLSTMLDEIKQFYENPDCLLEPMELTFRDYVLSLENRRNMDSYRAARDYWKKRIPTLAPAPDMPVFTEQDIRERPKVKRYAGGLSKEDWSRLKDMGRKRGLSPTSILAAAFSEVLRLWNREPDFCLNLTLFNRLPLHPQIDKLIGDFTDTLLLEVKANPDMTFEERAGALRDSLWNDLDNRQFSGMDVLRELNRYRSEKEQQYMPVVFTSAFLMGEYSAALTTVTLDGNPAKVVFSASQTPQLLIDHQVFEDWGRLGIHWDVRSEYFPPGYLDALFDAYTGLLERLAREPALWREKTVVELPETQLAQRRKYNATDAPIPEGLLHAPFLKRAATCPDAVAVITPERKLTYGEVLRRAAAVACELDGKVRPGELVAVSMAKGWEQVVAVLGILWAGAAYLPVDPAQPAERLAFILRDGNVRIVLTQSCFAASVEWPKDLATVFVDALEEREPAPLLQRSPIQSPDDLAYVVYTSGSTGAPKGVMIEHQAALNTIIDINSRFQINQVDRVFALASLSFDLSVWDVFGMLAAGGALVFPDPAKEKEPSHWLEMVEREGVTIWDTVPAMMQMLVEYRSATRKNAGKGGLRLVMLSGDWLPLSLPERIREQYDAQVVSLGGATEASIWSIIYPVGEIDPQWKSIPYGAPMRNQRFYVLNQFLQQCPDWVPGSLYIGGAGLARGYWNDPEKTKQAFIMHPVTGERLYRTGDVGYFHPDGYIVLMGREDTQLKIHGFRVELGEIEHVLRSCEGVKDAVVNPVKQGESEYLAAYVVPDETSPEALCTTLEAHSEEREQSWRRILDFDREFGKGAEADAQSLAAYALGEELYEAGVQAAFSELGLFARIGDAYSIEEIIRHTRISSRYGKWLRRALLNLCEKGVLVQAGERFRSVRPLEVGSVEALKAMFAGRKMDEFMYNTALHLADLLRERIHSAELYASPEAKDLYPVMFKSSCRLIGNALKLMEGERRQGKMTVLEVGAGHGGTTQGILAALDGARTDYLFTDISKYFLQNAETNFAAYDFVSYQFYDLNNPPEAQGLELHSYDAIVASSVVHDTRIIAHTLRSLLSLLKPGGILFLVEQTSFLKCFDLGMGLQQGFDVFEDTDLRPLHPLLSVEQWEECLRCAGFADVHVFPKLNANFASMGIDVICARAADILKIFESSKLEQVLESRLPAYMLPSKYIFMDALPLNRSGKVDRRALPHPGMESLQERRPYVAPRSETEKKLAAIWAETLHVDSPCLKDNFFELGGDSLLSTVLIGKVHETFGVELSVLDIYMIATLEDMARRIDAPAASGHGAVTALQPSGRETPWFCVPGAEGSLLMFAEMAHRLKPDTPLYGFQPAGMDGRKEPLANIEEMAAVYIEAMLKIQPEGPHRLIGFSMGGFVAYEMAAQLKGRGIPIEKVTLIDSYLLPREVYADDIRSLCVYAGMLGMPMSLVRGVNDDAHLSALNAMVRETDVKREPIVGLSELADMTQERRLSVLYERARGQGFFESMSEKRFRDGYAVLRSNLDAMHKYKPAHWQGRITFFRGTGNPQDGPDSMAYWSQAADMKVIEVPGNHLTVMSGDSLRMIMDAIRADA